MADAAAPARVIDTTLLNGSLKLRQLCAGHRAGTDAVLLASCIGQMQGTLIDLGAGAGAAGLAIAMRNEACKLILAECEPEIAAVAAENIALNGLAGRARVATVDGLLAKDRARAGLADHCADVLVTNPPYHDAAASRTSPDPLRARAHTLAGGENGGITTWIRACAALVRPGGTLALIHRADALAEIAAACTGRFGGLTIMPVHPRAGRPAIRVLIRATAGSRARLKLLPGLVLHEEDGAFTPLAAALHGGKATLELG